MRKYCRVLLAASSMLLLGACGKAGDSAATAVQHVVGVDMLSYEEREAGMDNYIVRVLVSPRHVRFDDGYAASDFALLERRSKTVFSVSHEDRSILVIETQPVNTARHPNLALTETRIPDKDAPLIAGKQPVHINYLADGGLCFQTISVSGVMSDALAGLAEYAQVLANRQLHNMETVPENMQTPCFLSRYVHAPTRHLRDRLPVQEWDETGYFRMLIDFSEDETVPAALFELPDEYERFSAGP